MTADGSTTSGLRRMSPVAAATSALLHATVLATLLPEVLPRHARLSEWAVVVTLEVPISPLELPVPASADRAARQSVSGSTGQEQAARQPGPKEAAAVLPPMPPEPDVALVVPSADAPPTVTARDFGNSASPPAPEPNRERVLPPVAAPSPITGDDFARKAPPVRPTSPSVRQMSEAPPPQQPVRQDRPKRTARQKAADGRYGMVPETRPPATAVTTDYGNQQAQQDYLWQVVRKLSQSRFYEGTGKESERGLVVARLTVGRDGRLLDVSLTRSSGFPGLDRSVIETIRRASPFAPLPAEMAVDRYSFIVPLNYERER